MPSSNSAFRARSNPPSPWVRALTARFEAEQARREAKALARGLGLPVLLQDERLTTFAVEDAIEEGRLPRPKKGQPIDHYAAAVILEDMLRAKAAAARDSPRT